MSPAIEARCGICGAMFDSVEARSDHYRIVHRGGKAQARPAPSAVAPPKDPGPPEYAPWDLRSKIAEEFTGAPEVERYANLRVTEGRANNTWSTTVRFSTGFRSTMLTVRYTPSIPLLLNELASDGWRVIGVETTRRAIFREGDLSEVASPIETTAWLERAHDAGGT